MSINTNFSALSGSKFDEQIEQKKNEELNSNNNENTNTIETNKRDLELEASVRQQKVQDKWVMSDRQWEALLQVSKGNKEEAQALIEGKTELSPLKWRSPQPKDIEAFFDKLLVDYLESRPQVLNQTGLMESIGVRDQNRYLDDYSIEGKEEAIRKAKVNLAALEKYDIESLTREQQISYKIFQWQLKHQVEGEKFLYHDYPVNQMFGPLSSLSETLTTFHIIESEEDCETYLERFGRIPKLFQQLKTLVLEQEKEGITPPKFAIKRVISSLKTLTDSPISEHPYYEYFVVNGGENKAMRDLLENVVNPAYTDFIAFLEKFSERITTNHSVLNLPDGEEYYAHCLKKETTTDLSAEEIYQLGLKEVAKIQTEMRQLLDSVGIKNDEKPVGELMAQLSEDEKHFYPNTEEGKLACIDGFKKILERSRKELAPYFDLKPEMPVNIIPTPKHEEEGMPGAYYYDPSLDGSRPGTFYVNLRDTKELPKFGMETLLVHEAEPGHHFQLTLQALSKKPLLQKLGEFNAYIEGWALYTEKLAYEKDFYTSAYDKLGHLQDELLRAVRLVVDPAIHSKGWTREKAIRYMLKQTGYKESIVVTEIERYFVIPGQACSYKVGQLKILELREKAMEALGEKFDIRKFHNAILEVGHCPLDILEEVVDNYVKTNLE